jgi:hypothetical protein
MESLHIKSLGREPGQESPCDAVSARFKAKYAVTCTTGFIVLAILENQIGMYAPKFLQVAQLKPQLILTEILLVNIQFCV